MITSNGSIAYLKEDVEDIAINETSGSSDILFCIVSKRYSPDSSNLFQSYLREISQYRLLSREEEIELAINVKDKDDKESASKLITSNLRLVVKIAFNFQHYLANNVPDLIQEGNIGLIHAVKKYDPYKGVKFSYYAAFWIRAYIFKFIMNNWDMLKIGTTQKQRKLFFNLNKERRQITAEGLNPEPKLLAERLGVQENDIVQMIPRLDYSPLSLNQPLSEDSKECLEERVQDKNASTIDQLSVLESKTNLERELKKFRKLLKGIKADIFDMRIMAENPVSLQSIGDRYQISRERVRQIQEMIINKIGKWLKKQIPNFEQDYSNIET
ncbi:sigma-70 family RNA polymerase sigma factor [Desulfobacterium sp. N47]|uniref:RNA polymerase sigma-70 domain-containing protein n=1 Tax=uncultured Desulfobacterium sp. TaxID=201089 RepID=E1YGB0_9BACT|nr:hypothetical protein N47_J05850 [uncultured Desulfobacterium sp.]